MKIKETTGCAGVMIGRAALGNPFVFSEIIAKNNTNIINSIKRKTITRTPPW